MDGRRVLRMVNWASIRNGFGSDTKNGATTSGGTRAVIDADFAAVWFGVGDLRQNILSSQSMCRETVGPYRLFPGIPGLQGNKSNTLKEKMGLEVDS